MQNGAHGAADHIQRATANSFRGLRQAIRSERAMRLEVVLLLLALPAGVAIAPTAGWYVAMIGVLIVTIAVELLNTAVEKLADHVQPERHPEIGFVKDAGSAAVLCMLVLAGLIWAAALAVRLGWL